MDELDETIKKLMNLLTYLNVGPEAIADLQLLDFILVEKIKQILNEFCQLTVDVKQEVHLEVEVQPECDPEEYYSNLCKAEPVEIDAVEDDVLEEIIVPSPEIVDTEEDSDELLPRGFPAFRPMKNVAEVSTAKVSTGKQKVHPALETTTLDPHMVNSRKSANRLASHLHPLTRNTGGYVKKSTPMLFHGSQRKRKRNTVKLKLDTLMRHAFNNNKFASNRDENIEERSTISCRAKLKAKTKIADMLIDSIDTPEPTQVKSLCQPFEPTRSQLSEPTQSQPTKLKEKAKVQVDMPLWDFNPNPSETFSTKKDWEKAILSSPRKVFKDNLIHCERCGFCCESMDQLVIHKCPDIRRPDVRRPDARKRKQLCARKRKQLSRVIVKPLEICKICKSKVGTNLQSHMKHHLKTFLCHQCGSRFADETHLRRHMARHSDAKPYKCKRCDYTCKLEAYLTMHMRTHTGEKPYSCNYCSYRSADRGGLKSHIRRNHEQPLKCDLCDFGCVGPFLMRVHKRVHTGENVFQCERCDYSTNRLFSLQRHSRKRHEDA